MSLGQRIKQRRNSLKITQVQLSESLGTTQQHISSIEQDTREPSLKVLIKMAEELGVTTDYLLTGKDSAVTDTIPAIKADKKLKLEVKKALIVIVQSEYTLANKGGIPIIKLVSAPTTQ